jgi:hypothetical protein
MNREVSFSLLRISTILCIAFLPYCLIAQSAKEKVTNTKWEIGDSCCKRVTKYNSKGGVTTKGHTVVEGDPVCTSIPLPGSCVGKGTSVGICNVACARL